MQLRGDDAKSTVAATLAVTRSAQAATTYTYNAGNRLTVLTDPSSNLTTNTFDNNGNLTATNANGTRTRWLRKTLARGIALTTLVILIYSEVESVTDFRIAKALGVNMGLFGGPDFELAPLHCMFEMIFFVAVLSIGLVAALCTGAKNPRYRCSRRTWRFHGLSRYMLCALAE